MSNIRSKCGAFVVQIIALLSFILLFVPIVSAEPEAELITFWDDREPLSLMKVDHRVWQEVLTAYVDEAHSSGVNRFDYAAVTRSDTQKLQNYLNYLQSMEPRQLNAKEAMAYWINMFNAVLVKNLVDAFQSNAARTSKKLSNGGLRKMVKWDRNVVEVAMQEISLNDIEHGILRPIWKDSRIHFVLSLGSLSGANIQKSAFNSDNIDALLEESKTEFLQHPRAVRVEGSRIILNSVFEWYESDFAASKSELLSYLRENVDDATRQAMEGLTIIDYDYDWRSNYGVK